MLVWQLNLIIMSLRDTFMHRPDSAPDRGDVALGGDITLEDLRQGLRLHLGLGLGDAEAQRGEVT